MKTIILSTFALLLTASGAVAQQNDGFPGVPQTESYVVTPVDTASGVTVRKVSFLRSNNIVLVGNLFLPKDFDGAKRYPAILSIHPAGSVKEQSAGLYATAWRRKALSPLLSMRPMPGKAAARPIGRRLPTNGWRTSAMPWIIWLRFLSWTSGASVRWACVQEADMSLLLLRPNGASVPLPE